MLLLSSDNRSHTFLQDTVIDYLLGTIRAQRAETRTGT